MSLGFEKIPREPTLYVRLSYWIDEHFTSLIVSLYVDDLLVIESSEASIKDFKQQMENMFEMSDLREMRYFLGMKVQKV